MSQNESDLEGLMLVELVCIYTNKIAIDLYGQGHIEPRSERGHATSNVVWRRQPSFSFFFFWDGEEKWSGSSIASTTCVARARSYSCVPIRLLYLVT